MIIDSIGNREVLYRENGHHDRICAGVYKLSNTPCNQIIVNGKRWLDFPEKKYCCFCCDAEHGCGVLAKDWLVQQNATYKGIVTYAGEELAQWDVQGLQPNSYFHANNEEKTPKRLTMGKDDFYNYTSYYVGIKDEKVFELPSYCTNKCGASTLCQAFRDGKNKEIMAQ